MRLFLFLLRLLQKRETIEKPLISLHKSVWADKSTPRGKYVQRDFAIRMGLYASGELNAYDLEVTRLDRVSLVYEPHKFMVKATTVTGSGWHNGAKITEDRCEIIFEFTADAYSIRGIFEGVLKGIKNKSERKYIFYANSHDFITN